MRKLKIKPNTFEDRATANAQLMKGPLDLEAIWKAERQKREAEVDKELDPEVINKMRAS